MIIPQHIGFIMDGNGRWAKAHGLPRWRGHEAGIQHIRAVLKYCDRYAISYVSAYVWSSENWRRPNDEVLHIMGFIRQLGYRLADDLNNEGVRIIHSGNRSGIDAHTLEVLDYAIELTRHNGPRVLNLAFNYGGRAELVHVAQQIIAQSISPDAVTHEIIEQNLYTAGLPDIDLIIRSGGDQRFSNFFLWQTAQSVVYFAESYWPALSQGEIYAALRYYNQIKSQ